MILLARQSVRILKRYCARRTFVRFFSCVCIFFASFQGERTSRWCFEIGAMIDQSQELHVLGSARGHSSWRRLRTISTGSSCPRGRYLVWQSKRSPCKSARAGRRPFACTFTVLIWQDAPILKRSDQLGCGRPLCKAVPGHFGCSLELASCHVCCFIVALFIQAWLEQLDCVGFSLVLVSYSAFHASLKLCAPSWHMFILWYMQPCRLPQQARFDTWSRWSLRRRSLSWNLREIE